MTTLSVRLPNSLHTAARNLAKQEDISINQLIATALAEKVSAITTVDYLEERARRGNIDTFHRLLAKAPDVEPEDFDRL